MTIKELEKALKKNPSMGPPQEVVALFDEPKSRKKISKHIDYMRRI